MTAMIHSLGGAWWLRALGVDPWLPATVPGGVHTDLLAAGHIPDPFVGDLERVVQWVAERDWEYRRSFTVDAELLAHDAIELVCDGLDTLAELWLNGQLLATTDNMFRQYRWAVGPLLHAGENELRIVFRSPVRYVSQRQAQRPMLDVNDVIHGAPYLRKAPSHFGWDWGPKLPPIGIWRDLRLEAYTVARLDDVHLRQQHADGRVTLLATVRAQPWRDRALRARLELIAPDGRVQHAEAPLVERQAQITLPVAAPQLWWPNGYGDQPLYRATVTLLDDEQQPLDRRSYTLGLRTIELRQQPDALGRSFTFVVNGVPIFAKGANWIPADSFPTRVSRERLTHLIGSAAAAHHNMVRVWGGGYYEDEAFYDLCDQHGLLVWQDFMFACALYPLDDAALLETIHAEVIDNVRRLRHRACLALWCGNNEIETAWVDWGWDRADQADLKAAYDRFFHQLLPAWVAAEDPDHPYWPSSPSSGTPFVQPNSGAEGDMHEWSVWHAMKPLRHYRAIRARFVSEFGFQSLPALATIATFAPPEEWNLTSYIMEHHQRNPAGNAKIITYLAEQFRLPRDFEALVYLSQVQQGEAMRIGVEHWRRDPACSGTLYWQLNDCWPVASWSSIDYWGRWKAAHYAGRRFFAPVLLSIADDGPRLELFVSNDMRAAWQGEVRWSLETLDGVVLEADAQPVTVASGTCAAAARLDLSARLAEVSPRDVVLVAELWHAGERQQMAIATFVPTKHLALRDPRFGVELQQEGEHLLIGLTARSLARFVELRLEGADVIFSDNYFDLPAGRSVQVTARLPQGWSLEQARAALRLRSVIDSY
ncbi:beta-mannosidase [Kallotenue papyrolyticum]|uniref:beta-mannosidase n=1 Tax=Kallotenue papyrolyticum TaxID=1325125 RepID=UPI0004B7674B|nr:glycoside hydrolase family 2 protein [Kallotenue papyrolyticum]